MGSCGLFFERNAGGVTDGGETKKPHRVISSEAFKDDWGVFFGARVYVAINCTT